jgi:flagellar protein FlaF
MNATHHAQNAYAAGNPGARAALTARDIEYQAFARVTAALTEAHTCGDIHKAAQALYDNVRLWTVLAADCAHPDNGLPVDLRGRLMGLAQFASTHMSKVLQGQATIDPLIEINTAIMRGLRAGKDVKEPAA